jgi:hypothetical protein
MSPPKQTIGGKDEPNIVCMWKSLWTSQHGTQKVKTLIVASKISITRDFRL